MRSKQEIELESQINMEKECMKQLLLSVKKHVVAGNLDLAEERMKDFDKSLKHTKSLVKSLKELRRSNLFGVIKKLNEQGCKVTTVSAQLRKERKA